MPTRIDTNEALFGDETSVKPSLERLGPAAEPSRSPIVEVDVAVRSFAAEQLISIPRYNTNISYCVKLERILLFKLMSVEYDYNKTKSNLLTFARFFYFLFCILTCHIKIQEIAKTS